ncbi:conserved hypothetical protein [Echinococcus multilocularis]|uniref:Uncharacterized protein n=1 Tax=Echinococcus multilocularis TaxID=6211 RepID=A0A087VY34_ECHMU|nr:conserved hypothetical protein [Echinococcus multilocularis]
MQTHHFSGMLLLLALMPISILASGVSVDSVIDSTIQDVVSYLTKYGAKYHVQSLGSLARSCPFTFNRTVPKGEANYKLGICFNVADLMTTPPIKTVTKVRLGLVKLEATLYVKTTVPRAVKLELSAPVFSDVYVYVFGIPIPAIAFKSRIMSQLQDTIEDKLRALIATSV